MNRRHFLKAATAVASWTAVPASAHTAFAALHAAPPRRLNLRNHQTGEELNEIFWEHGNYIQESLDAFSYLLRDFHNDQSKATDPRLLDALHRLQYKLDNHHQIEVVSAYRTVATNQHLREQGFNAADGSLHTQARAVDVVLPGSTLKDVRKAAVSLRSGGVGYYPKQGFIHLDTGRVRQW